MDRYLAEIARRHFFVVGLGRFGRHRRGSPIRGSRVNGRSDIGTTPILVTEIRNIVLDS